MHNANSKNTYCWKALQSWRLVDMTGYCVVVVQSPKDLLYIDCLFPQPDWWNIAAMSRR